ncbi:hypothetical protein ACA910_019111 [Epithemia clementina (nom. ined.)]
MKLCGKHRRKIIASLLLLFVVVFSWFGSTSKLRFGLKDYTDEFYSNVVQRNYYGNNTSSTTLNNNTQKASTTPSQLSAYLWPPKQRRAYLDLSKTYNTKCLIVDKKGHLGGWGNLLYQVFYALKTHNPDMDPPCFVDGEKAFVLTTVFEKMKLCDLPASTPQEGDDDDDENDDENYSVIVALDGTRVPIAECAALDNVRPSKHWFQEIFPEVADPNTRDRLLPYLELNKTHVLHNLYDGAIERIKTVAKSCAVHVRFGDSFFRTNNTIDNRMGCDAHPTNRTYCFASAAEWVAQVCHLNETSKNDASKEERFIYVASDVPAFTDYLRANATTTMMMTTPRIHILSANFTRTGGQMIHTEDLHNKQKKNYSRHDDHNNPVNEPHWHNVLYDWVSLGMANQTEAYGNRSTFSLTAKLRPYVVGLDGLN